MNQPHSAATFHHRGARLLTVAAMLALCGFAEGRDGAPLDPPLRYAPLPLPLVVTGGFGEYRIGHFHAGLDFGTRQRVGMHVRASAAGWVERLRASGVGYGRSVYLHTDDGRLIQLGHLDAFVEPLASYVRAKQDSSGQYEQDLWPEKGRFRFRAGQQLAWSGQSGAGGPHLHVEIRRGDVAYHPLRAGLVAADSAPPSLVDVTLEPLDDESFVAGSAAPRTIRLSARPDTVRAIGRLRAVVGARDGLWHGVDRMVPWSVSMEWGGREVECRFDSVSWATDMPEGDYVYDAGRVVGEKGLVLWAPPGFRPRVMRSTAPRAEEAGTILVRRGDSPRPLTLRARDLAGNAVERTVMIAADTRATSSAAPAAARASQPSIAVGEPDPTGAGPAQGFEFESLPGGFLRVTQTQVPKGATEVRISSTTAGRPHSATPSPRGWCVILPLGRKPGPVRLEEFRAEARTAQGRSWARSLTADLLAVDPRDSSGFAAADRRLSVPAGAAFERGVVLLFGSGGVLPTPELQPIGTSTTVAPATMPLHSAIHLSMEWNGKGRRGLGLYRDTEDGWDWAGATFDSAAKRVDVDTRRLGRFALFRDETAPRATLQKPPRRSPKGEYPTWALEAVVTEKGSGLDGRSSHLEIDGRAVPTEWDSESRTLRWRPARAPSRGTHRVAVVMADRAGNVGRETGTFVLD